MWLTTQDGSAIHKLWEVASSEHDGFEGVNDGIDTAGCDLPDSTYQTGTPHYSSNGVDVICLPYLIPTLMEI